MVGILRSPTFLPPLPLPSLNQQQHLNPSFTSNPSNFLLNPMSLGSRQGKLQAFKALCDEIESPR